MDKKIQKVKRGVIIILMTLMPFSLIFQSCEKDSMKEIIDEVLDEILKRLGQTGWLAEDEEMENIPEDITPFPDPENGDVAASASLESKFPPIGDQGQYGTCVAWAVGYNLKTSLNAIEKGWSSSELASEGNQTSPKDLWQTIASGDKGTECNGTNFEPALDALITSGAATLSSVPYTSLGNCTGTSSGYSANKLANYRKIASETEGLNKENFKGYLNSGRPIAIGAKLGDRFMTWNSSGIINSDTYNNPGMQHAYHAMALVGYDDAKNAFRVRNSWGTSWGDNGSIWVDYTFFCNSFCFAAFVAQNVNSVSAGSGGIGSGNLSNGADLMAYFAEDHDETTAPADWEIEEGYNRAFTYQVYNSGTTTITPSQDWTVTYMLYNAKNAKENDIIFEDYYTTKYGPGDDWVGNANFLSGGGWYNNASVSSGKMAGEAEFGEDGFIISYNMPGTINGQYYLVVMADSYDKIKEVNEDNNFYFISAKDGKPLTFVNGKITNLLTTKSISRSSVKTKRPAPFSDTETQSLVKPGNLNTYTPAELKAMLLHDKATGKLESKIKAYRVIGDHTAVKKRIKK
jgi:C1A family cysteine protease